MRKDSNMSDRILERMAEDLAAKDAEIELLRAENKRLLSENYEMAHWIGSRQSERVDL